MNEEKEIKGGRGEGEPKSKQVLILMPIYSADVIFTKSNLMMAVSAQQALGWMNVNVSIYSIECSFFLKKKNRFITVLSAHAFIPSILLFYHVCCQRRS